MKLLADQDVYQATIDFLKTHDFTVICAKEVGLSAAPDSKLLIYARRNKLTLITRDKDFGGLVFLGRWSHYGVILLRINPLTTSSIHEELSLVLKKYQKETLTNSFVVIEPGRHRIRTTTPTEI